MKHLRYLKYVLRHKYYVFVEGMKLGPNMFHQWPAWILRLIFHDWSKFRPSEWIPYCNHFYGVRPPYETKTEEYARKRLFERAIAKHYNRNDHHPAYWTMLTKGDTWQPLVMPDLALREMVADWYGANRSSNSNISVWEWYDKNGHNLPLHPLSRFFAELIMGYHAPSDFD